MIVLYLRSLKTWMNDLPQKTKWAIAVSFCMGIIVHAAGTFVLHHSSAEHATGTTSGNKATPVAVHTVKKRPLSHQFLTHSFLQPKKEVLLRPNGNVTVRSVLIEVGQNVKAGDVLAYTDSEAQALRAKLDKIDMKQKELDYQVTVALAKKSFISSKEYQQRELEQQANRIRRRLTELETTGAIISPINGVISEIALKTGDYIDNPSQYYIKIADASSFRLQLYLPQNVASKIKKGSFAELSRTKADEFGAESVEAANATVLAIAPVVDPKSGSVLTDLEASTAPEGWIAGMYVQVAMIVDQALDSLAVPNESLIYEGGQTFVFRTIAKKLLSDETGRGPATADEGPRVEKVPVTTGLRDSLYTEIKKGLEDFDMVVVEGQGNLAPNSLVEIVRQAN